MTHADQLHHRVQVVDPETGLLTPFFFRWLVALYERTGGPNDNIGDLENEILYTGITDSQLTALSNSVRDNYIDQLVISDSRVAALQKALSDLHTEFETSPVWQSNHFFNLKLFSKSANFTTYESCIVVATSNITVTLNTNPKDQEKVIVKRATTAGSVTIASSPINVDGAASYVLLMNYEAAQCVYSAVDNEWFIV